MNLRLIGFLFVMPSWALALPNMEYAENQNDGLTVNLKTFDRFIEGDLVTRCSGAVVYDGAEENGDRRLTVGDPVKIELVEDDWLLDDALWEERFTIDAAQAAVNRFSHEFDCSRWADIPNENTSELRVRVSVDLETCQTVSWRPCIDEPDVQTPSISVVRLNDDDAEDGDDDRNSGTPLELQDEGTRAKLAQTRIARDDDWFSFRIQGQSGLTLELDHFEDAGAIELALFHEQDFSAVLPAVPNRDGRGSRYIYSSLSSGDYALRVKNTNASDLNFYDLYFTLVEADCAVGETRTEDCGNCGTRILTCESGTWVEGQCDQQGECRAGDTRQGTCGSLCGFTNDVCNAECQWDVGSICMGEGVCEEGEIDVTADGCAADGQFKTRVCNAACRWPVWSECTEPTCEDGENAICYTGPAATAGVGQCVAGIWRCNNGSFGDCIEEVLPTIEVCTDDIDNDCDGKTDADDEECSIPIGGPCSNHAQCDSGLQCFQEAVWTDGYCGELGCDACEELGGVCATTYGARRCLAPCEGEPSCRNGSEDYLCVPLGPDDEGACIPACNDDVDCVGLSPSVCNDDGRCIPGMVEGEGSLGGFDSEPSGGITSDAAGGEAGWSGGVENVETGGAETEMGGSDDRQPVPAGVSMMADLTPMPTPMPTPVMMAPNQATAPTSSVTNTDNENTEAGTGAQRAQGAIGGPASDDDGCACDVNSESQNQSSSLLIMGLFCLWSLRRRGRRSF